MFHSNYSRSFKRLYPCMQNWKSNARKLREKKVLLVVSSNFAQKSMVCKTYVLYNIFLYVSLVL